MSNNVLTNKVVKLLHSNNDNDKLTGLLIVAKQYQNSDNDSNNNSQLYLDVYNTVGYKFLYNLLATKNNETINDHDIDITTSDNIYSEQQIVALNIVSVLVKNSNDVANTATLLLQPLLDLCAVQKHNQHTTIALQCCISIISGQTSNNISIEYVFSQVTNLLNTVDNDDDVFINLIYTLHSTYLSKLTLKYLNNHVDDYIPNIIKVIKSDNQPQLLTLIYTYLSKVCEHRQTANIKSTISSKWTTDLQRTLIPAINTQTDTTIKHIAIHISELMIQLCSVNWLAVEPSNHYLVLICSHINVELQVVLGIDTQHQPNEQQQNLIKTCFNIIQQVIYAFNDETNEQFVASLGSNEILSINNKLIDIHKCILLYLLDAQADNYTNDPLLVSCIHALSVYLSELDYESIVNELVTLVPFLFSTEIPNSDQLLFTEMLNSLPIISYDPTIKHELLDANIVKHIQDYIKHTMNIVNDSKQINKPVIHKLSYALQTLQQFVDNIGSKASVINILKQLQQRLYIINPSSVSPTIAMDISDCIAELDDTLTLLSR